MSKKKKRNEPDWVAIGFGAGFVLGGLIVVVIYLLLK
jgi:uncharacterized membrane protein YciS (DUF1049 family)